MKASKMLEMLDHPDEYFLTLDENCPECSEWISLRELLDMATAWGQGTRCRIVARLRQAAEKDLDA